jgi:hypothetical protein
MQYVGRELPKEERKCEVPAVGFVLLFFHLSFCPEGLFSFAYVNLFYFILTFNSFLISLTVLKYLISTDSIFFICHALIIQDVINTIRNV